MGIHIDELETLATTFTREKAVSLDTGISGNSLVVKLSEVGIPTTTLLSVSHGKPTRGED